MPFGLENNTIAKVEGCLKENPKIKKAVLYGSRAKGNYRNGSDIDLVLLGENLDYADLAKLEDKIDDLLLPYKFDLSIFHQIDNAELIQHIERVGKVFFERPDAQQA